MWLQQSPAAQRIFAAAPVVPANRLVWALLLPPLVTLFMTRADIYLFTNGMLPLRPWLILIPVTLPLIAYAVLISIRSSTFLRPLADSSAVWWWFVLLVWISLVSMLPRLGGAVGDARAMVLPVLDLYTFLAAWVLARMLPPGNIWRVSFGLAWLVAVGSIFVDAIVPGTFSDLRARAAGLPVNPNGGAMVVAALLVLLLNWQQPTRRDLALLLVSGVAVFLTLSRGGIIVWLLLAAYCVHRIGGADLVRALAVRVAIVAVLVGLFVGAIAIGSTTLAQFSEDSSRIDLMLGRDFSVPDYSTNERLKTLRISAGMIQHAPLLGHGSGTTYEMEVGPHNNYLARWIDNGLPGLVAFCGLLVALSLHARRTACIPLQLLTVMFALLSLISHNMLEDRTWLIALAVSLAWSAPPRRA